MRELTFTGDETKRPERGADGPAVLDLPHDRSGAARSSGEAVRSCLVGAADDAVGLLSAFAALLFRLTGQTDFVIGMPAAGGADIVAVRLQLSGAQTLGQIIAHTRETLRGDAGDPAWPAPNVLCFDASGGDPQPRAGGATGIDLALGFSREPDGLRCAFHYAADRFAATTIDRWLDALSRLIAAAADAPGTPVAALPIVAPHEREQQLREWNSPPLRSTTERALRMYFEARTAAAPTAVALADGSATVTYGQLNARANQLARALRARGIGPTDIVALGFERVPSTVTAMLAILKAGAAYLPFDLATPPDRLRFMYADAGARLVLTDNAGAERLAPLVPPDACVNIDSLDLGAYPSGDLPAAGTPNDLAYVMYTSGTTGRPKGVLVTQRGVTNLVLRNTTLAINETDVVGQIANIAFDAATFEIWGALLNGARLAIAPRSTVIDPKELAAWLRDHGISVAFVTSALLRHISRAVPDAFATLRCLIAGGDVVDSDAARTVLTHGAPERFLNGYGPTEATTFATIFEITEAAAAGGSIPIGRPLTNVQAYILDGSGNLVPIGVHGQLHIGGLGLARGYVNDPELTARAFVRHPFSPDPSDRLYATGDIARYRDDGTIEFLGRRDRQVKIRGFRIELDDVTAALRALPEIADAVVATDTDDAGDRRLVAYVVDAARTPRSARDLRSALAERLPTYMLPTVIASVAEIPLNANGKLDLTHLAEPQGGEASALPTTPSPIEADVCHLLGELLGVADVAPADNFFALGGHSLLAMRALAHIEARFGVRLPVRQFFAGPTAAELARHIAAAPLRALASPAPSLDARIVELRRDQQRAHPIPLSAAQRRLWLLDQLEPERITYNVPYAFTLRGPLDRAALETALQSLVRRHDILRSTLTLVDGEPAYLVHDRFAIQMPLIECASPESLAGILAHERAHTFDLTQEFPMRAVLVHCASDEHVLLVTIHHIATDGWSMGIFKRELGALYSAQHSGIAPSLDPLPATYADFAEQQALSLAEPGCAARLEYWQTMLAEPPPPLTFAPRADAGPATFSGGLRSRVLAPATRAALDAFCRAEGTTEFAVLYAVFAELLHRSTGQRDFVLGSVVANRAQPEFAGLIGFFVNTVALRVRIDAGRTFRSWLGDVGRTIVEAFDHHDVPFEKVVEAVRPVRTATRTPLINVMMVFQNAPDDGLELAGIEVEPLALERTTAKFDLTLEVTTTPDRAITIAFEYRTDLFAEATIEALLTDLEELTATSLAEPDGRLAPFVADQTPQRDSPATAIAGGPPAPSIRASGADLELEPAEAEARVALRSIWESVLGVTPIGLAENFFDIGGHSLLAVRVMNEIQQTFGIVVPVSLLFAEPTIEQLARALTSPPFTPSAEAVVTYNAAGTAAPFFFFHGSITGNGTYCRVLAERVGPDRPLHVLRPHGSDGAPVPASIEAMAAESLGVIRRLAPRGPYLLGGYCAGGLVAFEVARLLRAAGEEVLDVLLIDVPDAPTGMLAVADGIDRVGALLHIDRHQRLRLTGGIARVPHHGIRFASTSTKVDFVKARLSRALHRSAPSDPGTAVATAQRNTYIDWVRRTEAHVPRRYDGRVSLFLTREEGPSAPGDRGGWLRIAPRARVRSIAGTHVNCVTEFIDSTATAVAETIAVHIDERATSSTAEITR